jgi:hypothetical protein
MTRDLPRSKKTAKFPRACDQSENGERKQMAKIDNKGTAARDQDPREGGPAQCHMHGDRPKANAKTKQKVVVAAYQNPVIEQQETDKR